MTERYSHPPENEGNAVPLDNHLTDVADRVRDIVPDEASMPSDAPMGEFVTHLALIHDFGKLTTWFQQHIGMVDGDPTGKPTHHALIGAVLAYYVLDSMGYDDEECLAGYVAVAKHHGTLPDVPKYVFKRTAWNQKRPVENERQEEIIEQVADIDESVPALAEEIIDEATDGRGSWEEFTDQVCERSLFEAIKRQVSSSGFTHDAYGISTEFYPCVLQAWSALVLADKTSAAHAPRSGYESEVPPRSTLTKYIDELPDESMDLSNREQTLNNWRSEARASVLANVEEFAASDGVATLTLPTGMGKTLTGLDAALTVCELTDRKRIVYALPFTSIIDQLSVEIQEIFDTDGADDLLTIHHHLSETVVDLGMDTDEYAAIEEMLGESWRSGLVVTTYVQLFESLVSPANMQSMKLPALYDSVIILDEPQSIPHDWWLLVQRVVEILTTEYNAAVISMTATQPELFGSDTPELVDNSETYFREIERVEYRIDKSIRSFPDRESGPVSYGEAADRIVDAVDDRDNGDVLTVCNTIDSAQELTDAVVDRTEAIDIGELYSELLIQNGRDDIDGERIAEAVTKQGIETAVLHLSTRIRPRDRLLLIEAAKEITNRAISLITVSTQLVEAGVDISFDYVYRDFAPMDSLVQAAGRCNRSFEREQGTVTIWWLAPPLERDATPGVAVYDKWGDSLLSLTAQVLDSYGLNDHSSISESTVASTCVREYYRRLIEEKRVGKQTYVDLLRDGKFEEAGTLSLIDQRLAIDVIVCRTDDDRNLIDSIKAAWDDYEFQRVRRLIDNTRDIQISVPIYRADSPEAETLGHLDRIHPESDIRWLDERSHEYTEYFDSTTGLVIPDTTVERRFL